MSETERAGKVGVPAMTGENTICVPVAFPMMRWIQQDPMGYVDGMNDYGFVRDNPISWIDPTGLARFEYDGQGFHVHDTVNGQKITYGIDFSGGNATYSVKPGHADEFPGATEAEANFNELMQDVANRAKAKSAIADAYEVSKDQEWIAAQGRGFRQCQFGIALAAFALALDAYEVGQAAQQGGPVAAANAVADKSTNAAIGAIATTTTGYAANSLVAGSAIETGVPALAAGTGLAAATTGTAVLAAAGVGYEAGTLIAKIPTGNDQTVSDRIGTAIYGIFWWAY